MELNVMDTILNQFQNIFSSGVPTLRSLMHTTFLLLITIDVFMSYLSNLEDGNHIKITIQKCLKVGLWLFIVNNWGMLCSSVKDSFITAGNAIGSGGGTSYMMQPSKVVDLGLSKLDPMLNYLKQFSGINMIFANYVTLLMCLAGYLIGCICFFIMGIQIFLTYVEFYLVAVLYTIFIPFGVSKYTSFLAEKAIGGVISYGVKLMVLSAILAIIVPIITQWQTTTVDASNALTIVIGMVAVPMLLAFLCWQAPSIAGSIMTGGPSLSAGNMAQAALGAGLAVAGVAAGGSALLSSVGNSSVSSATQALVDSKGDTAAAAGAGGDSGSASGSASGDSPTFSNNLGSNGSDGSSGSNGTGSSGSDGSSGSNGTGSSGSDGSSGSNGTGSSGSDGSSGSNSTGLSGSDGSSGSNGTGSSGSDGSSGSNDTGSSGSNNSNAFSNSDSNSSDDANSGSGSNSSDTSSSPKFSSFVQHASTAKNSLPQEASPKGGINAPIKDD